MQLLTKDKIRISSTVFESFFDTSITNILGKASDIREKLPDISSILVVGGFAECRILTERLRERFINHTILVPDNPSVAVLKGAVMFGINPTAIRTRVCRYTYGIANQRKFIHGKDPIENFVLKTTVISVMMLLTSTLSAGQ